MEYVDASEMHIPKIGLGTWQMTGDEARGAVERALELGYRHIDTAQSYGNEAMIGGAIQTSGIPREELFITTKIDLGNLRYDDVLRTCHDSRRRLALDYIDLLLIHWPSEEVPMAETLRAMLRLQEEATVQHLGVSNFTPPLLTEALTMAPISNVQVEYHPFLAQHELLRICRERDLVLTAYSPIAHGLVEDDPTLLEIGERHGKTPAQVTLRWLIQQHNVCAIPKASTEEHLRENLDVFDFELARDEVVRIAELDRGERLIDPDFAPKWDRHSSP